MSFKAFNCPKCLKVFPQVIRVCETGHSICINCCKKISACSICKQSITETRNYALEKVILKMPFSKRSQEPGCKKCSICQVAPQWNLLSHLVQHSILYLPCARTFSYTKVFQKTRDEVEDDFLIINWNDIIFNFYIQVQHKAGNVCFAMHVGEDHVKKRYVFEVNYTRVTRRDKFVGSVLEAALAGGKKFSKGCITIPKKEFLKAASNFVDVKVYCDIREAEGVSSVAKPSRAVGIKSKK